MNNQSKTEQVTQVTETQIADAKAWRQCVQDRLASSNGTNGQRSDLTEAELAIRREILGEGLSTGAIFASPVDG
jgi:hypothetical protein